MYVSLYRKYRPQTFSEVVGQDAATNLLRASFLDGRLGHAYLFSGPRGCGKTTAARLLAKIVNCENPTPAGEPCCVCRSCIAVVGGDHMDVMEIDGASNRGIDQIRELKSHVGLASFMGRSKVYILDEVHMLTMEAFNALLKTLEEPPSSVLFIFATTEPHKVPVTIRSRCQHIPFHRIGAEDMVAHLKHIAALEGVETEDAALWELSRNADGALRDALSLAEQAISLGGGRLDADAVRALFGGGSRRELEDWLTSLRCDPAEASASLKSTLEKGVTPERLLDTLFPLIRDLWVYSLWGERSFNGASTSEEEKAYIRAEAVCWTSDALERAAGVCASLLPRARWGLKSDVFSGLLLFELLAALERPETVEPREPEQKTIPARRMPPPEAPRRSETAEQERIEERIEEKGDPVPPPPAAVIPPPSPTAIPAFLAGLDLPIAAALVDVKISAVDGALVFDCAEASPLARAVLEMPRAKLLISRAFGLEEPEKPEKREKRAIPVSPEAQVPKDNTPRLETSVPTGSRSMTIEERAAYLGADLLMYKPLSALSDESDDDSPEIYTPPE